MAESAAWRGLVKHATTLGGSYTAVDGVRSCSIKRNRAELDTSDFKDQLGWKKFIPGLAELTVDISGQRIAGDTQQDAILAGILAGTTVFITVLPDGTNGFKGEFLVNSFDPEDAVDGLDQFSASLRMTGAPTAVP